MLSLVREYNACFRCQGFQDRSRLGSYKPALPRFTVLRFPLATPYCQHSRTKSITPQNYTVGIFGRRCADLIHNVGCLADCRDQPDSKPCSWRILIETLHMLA